ncbi:hypothetical protein ABW21_db0205493 [Orbilia brochopaga]|nr:hypothetical protein ABW21_db0205493 [Drechslerella brochopaga]
MNALVSVDNRSAAAGAEVAFLATAVWEGSAKVSTAIGCLKGLACGAARGQPISGAGRVPQRAAGGAFEIEILLQSLCSRSVRSFDADLASNLDRW